MAAGLIPKLQTFDDGEPRIRDLDLAVALGYANALDIRKLIIRHRARLEEFGVLATVAKTSGASGGRPTQEFWLTKKQALLLCTYAETEKADEVRLALVEAFELFCQGGLVPATDTIETRILTIQQAEITALLQPLEKRVAAIEVTTQRTEVKLNEVDGKLDRIEGKLDVVVEDVKRRRKEIGKLDLLRHQEFLQAAYRGICPCCRFTIITSNGRPMLEFTTDHWYAPWLAGLRETWPVCGKCNEKLKNPEFKTSRQSAFDEYQWGLDQHQNPLFAASGIDVHGSKR